MLLALNIDPSRRVDLLTEQALEFDPPLEAWHYNDGFGNFCTRIAAPRGVMPVATRFDIYDTGEPDLLPMEAQQQAIQELPNEVLVYLLGSRFTATLIVSAVEKVCKNTSDGSGSKRSVISYTGISDLTIKRPTPRGLLMAAQSTKPVCVGTLRTLRLHFAAA